VDRSEPMGKMGSRVLISEAAAEAEVESPSIIKS
jgi:hypothetical protein